MKEGMECNDLHPALDVCSCEEAKLIFINIYTFFPQSCLKSTRSLLDFEQFSLKRSDIFLV